MSRWSTASSLLFPELAVYRANQRLGQTPDAAGWDAQVQAWEQRLASKPGTVAATREAYRADLARLRRLEDKLQAHLGFMTPFVPVASAIAAVLFTAARDHYPWWAIADLWLVALLVVHLAAGFFLALQGVASAELYLAGRKTLEAAIEDGLDADAQMAAAELVAMRYNEAVGTRLNNAIAGVAAALVWESWLLGEAS